ncbi:MAG: DUF6106 family protein [Bacillota bacterium]|nr:DUF6106 family protein [Bacillota bacterium]
MDVFIEKIVARNKTILDLLIVFGLLIGSLLVIYLFIAISVITFLIPFAVIGLIYVDYLLITKRNIEFEYIVTNGDLDIDMIISRKKRKRIFSANCKDFEFVASCSSDYYTPEIKKISKTLHAEGSMLSPSLYFILLNYKGIKTVVYFEPDERILNSLKTYAHKKILIS